MRMHLAFNTLITLLYGIGYSYIADSLKISKLTGQSARILRYRNVQYQSFKQSLFSLQSSISDKEKYNRVGQGEFEDWINNAYDDDSVYDEDESLDVMSDMLRKANSSDLIDKAVNFPIKNEWEGWSEEPPYFDEIEIEDDIPSIQESATTNEKFAISVSYEDRIVKEEAKLESENQIKDNPITTKLGVFGSSSNNVVPLLQIMIILQLGILASNLLMYWEIIK